MPKDRDAFRERFLRWRQTGELPYEAGRPIEQTDAVRTDQQSRQQLRQSVAGANEALRQAMMQRATVNPTQVSADTRTATERRQLQQQAAVERERYRKQQQKEKAQKGFETLMSLTAPSTYIGQAIGQPITGAAALATDALVLGAAGALKSGVKAATRRMAITPRITAKNAAGITPEQWTIAQDAAIARGDMTEAQRLRDLHFKVSAPDNKLTTTLYHGTDSEWNSYDPTHFSSGSGDLGAWGKGLYLSGYKNVAERYGKNIKSLYAYARNPLEVKPTLGTWYDTPTENAAYFFNREKGATKEIKNILKGKDAINKYREITGDHWITTHEPYEEVVIPQGKNIKSADAVTYDDKGVRIPLGERDNFKLNDIRYNIRNISGQEINSAINRGFTERFAQQFHQFPQEVENILTSQIVPRRLRMLKRNQSTDGAQKIEDFVKRNGEVDFSTASGLKTAKEQGWTFEEVQDYMQYKDYQSALNEMLSNGYTQYPRDAWNARHPAPDKNTLITGVYDGTTDKIELPEGFNALDAAHEARHRMQMKTPTIHTEENILHNAYDYNLRDTEFGKMIYEKELETVNLELREALLRENKASNMSLNTQDALLGSNVWYSDDHILHTLQRTNSYGKHIVENINRRIEQIKKSIQNKGLIPGTKEFDDEVSAVKHSIVENIRYAVQAVGVAAAAIKLNNK